MKRWFILLLAALLFFGGCQSAPDMEGDAQDPGGKDSGADLVTGSLSYQPGEMIKLFDALTNAAYGGCNARGSYIVEPQRNKDYSVLYYTDFERATHSPLCDVPNCAHDSAGCPAVAILENGEVFVAEDRLFYILSGREAAEYGSAETVSTFLRTSDLDGGNMRDVLEITAPAYGVGARSINSLFYDGSYLYLHVGEQTEEMKPMPKMKHELWKVNAETGEAEKEYVLFESVNRVSIEYIGEDTFRLESEEFEDGMAINAFEDSEAESPVPMEIPVIGEHLFSLDTGEVKTLGIYENIYTNPPVSRSYFLRGGISYSYQPGTREFASINPKTLEVTNILCLLPELDGDTAVSAVYGDRLILSSFDDSADPDHYEKGFFYKIQGGELTEIELRTTPAAHQPATVVKPIAETETQFYVIAGYEPVKWQNLLPNGQVEEFDGAEPVYAMIDKEDYFNNVPNYRYIADTPSAAGAEA